ncbi:MAG: PASTA domain-containing protein [Gemmatimonadaceae bacterium]|nr:PASTA domain-containing protein [Gemmatimonadaceae bacterium]
MNWRGSMRRLFAYLVVAVAGFMLMYLVAAFVVFPSGGVIPEDGAVPAVTGLPVESAMTELRRAGFQPEQGETRFHPSAPKGTVLEQSPPGGAKELMGSKVTLAVSGGQATQPVPNVVGMARDAAERALEAAGFDVGATEDQVSNEPAGRVLDSRPAPGTSATVPSTVVLVVSSGPTMTVMPDVVGLSLADARQMIAAAGLVAGDIAYEPAPGVSIITVQSPAAGTQLAQRARVSLRLTGETPP